MLLEKKAEAAPVYFLRKVILKAKAVQRYVPFYILQNIFSVS